MERKRILKIDEHEQGIIINALVDMRNDLIDEQRAHDAVDDVILKVADAPLKNGKQKGDMR
ncbi:MAG: hypothetical protein ACOYU3_01285 [Bacillota bacterium]